MKRYDWEDVEELAEHLFDEYDYMLPWFRDAWNIVVFKKTVTETNITKSILSISDQSDILLWLIALYDFFYDYQTLIGDQEGTGEYESWDPDGYIMKDYNAKNLGEKIQSISNWEQLVSEFVKEAIYRRLVGRQDLFLDQDSSMADFEKIPEQTNYFENLVDYTIDNLISDEIRERREKCIDHIYKYFKHDEVSILFFMAGYHARDHYTDYKKRLREIETLQAEALESIDEQIDKGEDPEMDESDVEWEYEQMIEGLNTEFPVSIMDLEHKVNDFDYFGEIGPVYDWINRGMD